MQLYLPAGASRELLSAGSARKHSLRPSASAESLRPSSAWALPSMPTSARMRFSPSLPMLLGRTEAIGSKPREDKGLCAAPHDTGVAEDIGGHDDADRRYWALAEHLDGRLCAGLEALQALVEASEERLLRRLERERRERTSQRLELESRERMTAVAEVMELLARIGAQLAAIAKRQEADHEQLETFVGPVARRCDRAPAAQPVSTALPKARPLLPLTATPVLPQEATPAYSPELFRRFQPSQPLENGDKLTLAISAVGLQSAPTEARLPCIASSGQSSSRSRTPPTTAAEATLAARRDSQWYKRPLAARPPTPAPGN
eukprot:CAMPEP_0179207784 /NCGR_PEP_ID=MMETSP0796-20121207/103617_1 /TAXON_ID=73915 /ORGANISM="Pyrodinium bahamense, Strain pbaha01" /LENGTH=317 /DNA_ID=CAMNT_0020912723 /DNA_START=107 /DNA_END=1057 /DNA_ORIENTATION=-